MTTKLKYTRLINKVRVNIEIELREKKTAKCWQTLKNLTDVKELSIVGVIKEDKMGFCGGQCYDSIENAEKFVFLWKKYHLNDLKAGTKKQIEYIESLEATGFKYEYSAACNALIKANLYEVEIGLETYKYGHGWLYMPLPNDILNQLETALTLSGFSKV